MIETLWFRMLCLAGAAALGVWLSGLDAIVYCLAGDLTGRYATSIKLTLLGFPIFAVLWFLRNHDVQSRLKQSELFAAIGWLAGATLAEKVMALLELKRLRDLYPEFEGRIDRATRTGIDMALIPANPKTGAPEKKALLMGADLSGMDLSNILLRCANMEGAILEGTKFHHANLFRTNMAKAKLRGAEFNDAEFGGDVNFESAEVAGTKFINTNLTKSKLHNIEDMKKTDFTAANMTNVDLEDSNIFGGIFFGARLLGVKDLSEQQFNYLKDQGALDLSEA